VQHGAPIVFLAEGESVHAVDVSGPGTPEIVGSTGDESLERVNGRTRYGETLFAASKSGWLSVIDASDPRAPTHVGGFELRESSGIHSPHDAARYGEYVVVVNQTQDTHPRGGLVRAIEDGTVRSPDDFEVVGTFDHDRLNGCNRVVVREDRAYVANNYSETVAVLDLSTPSEPAVLDVVDASEEGPNGITFYREYLVAGSGRYLDLFEIGPPGSLDRVGRIADPDRFEAPGSAHDLEVVGDLAYVSAQAANRLSVYRLKEP